LKLTGLILTRMDGDSRGGAALSMRWVTGLPIKFLGVSEKVDGLDVFDARRLAGRILGRGDIVSLVERASQDVDQEKAERLAKKMAKGKFDLDDLADQLVQLQKMGGLGGLMGFLPGMNKQAKQQMAATGMDDTMLKRQGAIIQSMTKLERARPEILKASRKRRIAAGAGVDVPAVNKLLKMHRQMADMMKKMGKKGGKGAMPGMPGMPGGGGMGGGMPPGFDQAAGDLLKGNAPKGASLPGLPGSGSGNGPASSSGSSGLPGLPGGKPKK
jgi:signal recognition particle subunit SRP54